MKFSTILWIALAAVSLLGALNTSAIFFGLFTVSIFLTLLDLTVKIETQQLEQPLPRLQQPATNSPAISNTCPNCGTILNTDATFCSQCGEKVIKE